MATSEIQFQPSRSHLRQFRPDRKRFWHQYLFLRDLRKELRTPVELTLHGGRTLMGLPVSLEEGHLTLHHPETPLVDFVTTTHEGSILSLGLCWTAGLARYFIERSDREPWEPLGNLRANQLLGELAQRLPASLKLELKLDGAWTGATEEDFRILEDNLALFVRELARLQGEFPAEVGRLRAIAFTQPKGKLTLSTQPGTLVVQLPYESSAIFEVKNLLSDLLNQHMEKI